MKAYGVLTTVKMLLEDKVAPWSAEAVQVRRDAQGALQTFEEMGDADGAVAAECLLMGATLVAGDRQAAEKMATQKLSSAGSNEKEQGVAHLLFAEMHKQEGDAEKAMEEATQAIALFQKASQARLEQMAWQDYVMEIHAMTRNYREMLQAANQAITLSKRVPSEILKADALYAATKARILSKAKNSNESGKEALALYKKSGEKISEGRANILLAKSAMQRNNYNEATNCGKKALDIFSQAGFPGGVIMAMRITIEGMLGSGHENEALTLAGSELANMVKANHTRGQAEMNLLLFDIHRMHEDQEAHANVALDKAQEALESFRFLSDRRGEAKVWLKCADLHKDCRMFEVALSEAQQSLMIGRDLKDAELKEEASMIMTIIYGHQNKAHLSPHREEAMALLHEIGAAIVDQDAETFKQLVERFGVIGACVSEDEQMATMKPYMLKDPEAYQKFVAAHSSQQVVQEADEESSSDKVSFRSAPKVGVYFMFRIGGIQYGPRFRCADWSMARKSGMVHDEDVSSIYGVIRTQSHSDDWERAVKNIAFMLDCAMHPSMAVSCIGMGEP